MEASHRIQKEEFHSNNLGSGFCETTVLTFIAPLGLLVSERLRDMLPKGSHFFIQMFFFMTLFTLSVFEILNAYIACIILLSILLLLGKSSSPVHKSVDPAVKEYESHKKSDTFTVIKLMTLVLTVVCILAVDFPQFPRKYGKTTMFGYGLMDIGVGMFAYLNGVVCYIRHVNNRRKKPLLPKLLTLLLGYVRLVWLKFFNYHTTDVEYGKHFNFFSILSSLALLSGLVPPSRSNSIIMCILGSVISVFVTQKYRSYVFYDLERTTFLTSNVEFFISISGFVTIFYFSGIYIDLVIKIEKLIKENQILKALRRMLILYISFAILPIIYPPSRRLCDLSYVSWTMFMISGVSFVSLLIMHFFDIEYAGVLTNSALSNQMYSFLFANLLVGNININVNTLSLSIGETLLYNTLYQFGVSLFMVSAFFNKPLTQLNPKNDSK
ncbi:hypothetical protein PCE1_004717 [Barthelona sp. PCE]